MIIPDREGVVLHGVSIFFHILAIPVTIFMVEKYLRNLSSLILMKMEQGNYTVGRFADECGVSAREVSRIKNGEAKSINLDTLVKISENSGISYVDIFGLEAELNDAAIQKWIGESKLTHGGSTFYVSIKKNPGTHKGG